MYIYTNFMQVPPPPESAISDTDRADVVAVLRTLAILDHGSNGDLRPVSYFFDENNDVFRVSQPVVYGIVKEPRLSPSDGSTYLVNIGESVDVIASDGQLYKFVRH